MKQSSSSVAWYVKEESAFNTVLAKSQTPDFLECKPAGYQNGKNDFLQSEVLSGKGIVR
jgi:hypothetical protein